MSDEKTIFMDLVGRFVSGTLNEEQGKQLIGLIRSNPQTAETIRENVLVDFLLHKLYFNDEKSPDQFGSFEEAGSAIPQENWSDVLDDLVHWEKNAVSLSQPSTKDHRLKKNTDWFKWLYPSNKTTKKIKNSPFSNFLFVFQLSILIALVLGLSITHYREINDQYRNDPAPSARIVETIDAVWAEDSKSFKRGQGVDPGRLSLLKGLVKLRIVNGTEIILEGPVDFVLNDPMSGFCERGKLSAHIPPSAVGYEISTPFGRFIDRGTEFSLAVEKKSTTLDVITGAVDVSIGKQEWKTISKGKSVEVDPTKGIQSQPWKPDRFWNLEKFTFELLQHANRKKEKQIVKYRSIDRNPNLLCRFDFGDTEKGNVPNRALNNPLVVSPAHLRGGKIDDGPFYQTRSIRFSRENDFAKARIPGTFNSLTLVTTIRLDSKSNESGILLIDDNFFENPGAFVWQLTRSGKLQFHVNRKKGDPLDHFDSPDLLKRKDLGTWMVLAIVVNAAEKNVTHYINGQVVARIPWKKPIPLTCDSVTIGNLQQKRGWGNNRYLIGAFKDFCFFDRALSDQEILQISGND